MKKGMVFRRKFIVVCVSLLLCSMFFLVGCEKTAESTPTEYVKLEYVAGEGGSIDGEASQEIEKGGIGTTVIAIPNENYRFVKWSDGVTEAERTDENVTEDMLVTAIFERYIFTVEYVAGEGGSIQGELVQSISRDGKGTTVTAIPNENYRFVKWSDGVTEAERTDENVVEDISVTAIFERYIFTVKYVTGEGGSIQGELIQSISIDGKGTTVIAIPNENYRFVKWSDGVTEAERTDENVVEDISVTAIFERYIFTVKYLAGEGGSIQGELIQSISIDGKGTTVIALPNENYRFVKWSDGVTQAERTDEKVKKDITVTAIFERYIFTVEYVAGEGGSIQGEAIQTVEKSKNTTSVKAIADYGYKFVKWSDGKTTATRTDYITADKVFTAEFARITYSVTYLAGDKGSIEGNANQTVGMGDDATEVTAVPNIGYQFKEWSDGVTTATRKDINVNSAIKVTAIFEIKMCTIEYRCILKDGRELGSLKKTVQQGTEFVKQGQEVLPDTLKGYYFIEWSDGVKTATRTDIVMEDFSVIAYYGVTVKYAVADGVGGKLEGNLSQKFYWEDDATPVKAIAKEGYVFAGWSDLSLETIRRDGTKNYNWEFLAYFEPIQKTFKYDYGSDYKNPLVNSITIQRNNIQGVKFVVPEKENYIFCGWYADEEYTIRITNESGRYLYGYAIFSLQSDKLYAKWKKEDDQTDTHKILLIFVDEVKTTLYSKKRQEYLDVHYKMSALDYEMSKWIAKSLQDLFNEWFEGIIGFEVDSYYTTKTIGDGYISSSNDLFANKIDEVFDLMYFYSNTITTIGYGESESDLTTWSGMAAVKNACVLLWKNYWDLSNETPYNAHLDDLIAGNIDNNDWHLDGYIHEFIHTVETNFDLGYDLHTVAPYKRSDKRLYLLGMLEKNGVTYGIPMEYWKHQNMVTIQYINHPLQIAGSPGKIIEIGGEEDLEENYIVKRVRYGSDFLVEAVPNPGYRFVAWTDGVTTAIRHDTNIIAAFRVEAIYEKIN